MLVKVVGEKFSVYKQHAIFINILQHTISPTLEKLIEKAGRNNRSIWTAYNFPKNIKFS